MTGKVQPGKQPENERAGDIYEQRSEREVSLDTIRDQSIDEESRRRSDQPPYGDAEDYE